MNFREFGRIRKNELVESVKLAKFIDFTCFADLGLRYLDVWVSYGISEQF